MKPRKMCLHWSRWQLLVLIVFLLGLWQLFGPLGFFGDLVNWGENGSLVPGFPGVKVVERIDASRPAP